VGFLEEEKSNRLRPFKIYIETSTPSV
jgi:hypothetical protein